MGFRPFVCRLAEKAGLAGWVMSDGACVRIEAEGAPGTLDQFLLRIEMDRPAQASIQSLEYTLLDPAGFQGFEVRESGGGAPLAYVPPDVSTCPHCLKELFDPANRRYRYPFINCAHCGPRYSIVQSMPYGRAGTSMSRFEMCDACRAEYEDPDGRRFHAEPNACPACGPSLFWTTVNGRVCASGEDALQAAVRTLRGGGLVAVKGLGGFHLMADARNRQAVERLRKAKQRSEKPFALMFPALEAIEKECEISPLERRLLKCSEAPIVLARRLWPRARAARRSPSPSPPAIRALESCCPTRRCTTCLWPSFSSPGRHQRQQVRGTGLHRRTGGGEPDRGPGRHVPRS